MREIDGGICAVPGVRACGVKRGRYGVAMIACSGYAAGVFTRNRVRAAPIEVTIDHLRRSGGRIEGVIANSGSANAYTGMRGMRDAERMAGMMAEMLGCSPELIGVASTGVIGRYLDLNLISSLAKEAAPALRSTPDASREAAQAIMTTDTKVKEVAVEHEGFRLGGICKGAGMIEPDMATMLAFIYTDADVGPEIYTFLKDAVDTSFNMLTVDGDTSTNDTVLLTSTRAVECDPESFREALGYVCVRLAKMIARDGEGATKAMEVEVTGAASSEDARRAAKSIARSNLVKAALYGEDPNWGRIVCAAGRSGAEFDPSRISLSMNSSGGSVVLVDRGIIVDGVLEEAKKVMSSDEIFIHIDLGAGTASARSFGCDLTHEYVNINAKYTT
ncbi:MAG TPA: bifunctional ornithine acetyltransferase/N-acetylglutamate synthase [Methanothrix sp.]|nr:bifunctional ornithine acetyltransferase/N-acetylglutamate synthase [Methanothrix sp.]HOK58097.1 bifunctional ornithine acetyltransferase/N-acetylglutamate synthase [Methanothrix sp.]HOL43001.1 bifunctional ornithine acetyltransferase/N-acetylglutamate synthase [Methanothrix sp.]HPO88004.1 bifunctional ornithine acetyltransferase/N-acetylglutamate synthase [Methanothrix sp.]